MNTVLNFKTEKKLKVEAQKVARELGLPLGTIMNHYLKEFVREKNVSFTTHPTPTISATKAIRKMSADAKVQKNLSPTFTNVGEAVAWLEA